ncbi:T9SS type A sorting domain-containing protein, partial [Bernardetia sp.]|uniref:T9SS type A sorting domain-containing protein n=1 Tax=Bernardetia sp. TaxID=1937974 RepID=UPI0025C69A7A
LLVYPNPIQDVVKVKSKDKILAIDILNVQGQVVSSVQNSNTIKLNNVAKGMYLLKVTTDKGIQTKRIVKE